MYYLVFVSDAFKNSHFLYFILSLLIVMNLFFPVCHTFLYV